MMSLLNIKTGSTKQFQLVLTPNLQISNAYPHPEKLRIRDMAKVGALINSLVAKGPEALQVITDFDYTLSKSKLEDGRPGDSGPGVMNNSPLLSQEFRDKVNALRDHYRPLESDHSVPIEKKIPLMVEWYEKRRQVTIESKVNKRQLVETVKNCQLFLRDGATEALKMLDSANVPLLIFSAGNGDVVELVLQRDSALFPNAHVISNFFKYDDAGYVIDYRSKVMLHVYNKNEHAVEHSSGYFQDLAHRPNALVLGDHLADAQMADGMQKPASILKIGFLNDDIVGEETLKLYQATFDVVLIQDQSFDFVNILLKHILGISD